jgi:rRNA maturation RNase YbeY
MASLDVRDFTRRGDVPVLPFTKIADAVLPEWELSLVFAGTKRAQALNMELRGKNYIPNVLSYAVDESEGKKRGSGEIIICPDVAKKQAPEYEMTYKEFVGFLFIHGLLHLKGMPHGATMERRERELLSRFIRTSKTSNGTTNSNRHRHRYAPDEDRRR